MIKLMMMPWLWFLVSCSVNITTQTDRQLDRGTLTHSCILTYTAWAYLKETSLNFFYFFIHSFGFIEHIHLHTYTHISTERGKKFFKQFLWLLIEIVEKINENKWQYWTQATHTLTRVISRESKLTKKKDSFEIVKEFSFQVLAIREHNL